MNSFLQTSVSKIEYSPYTLFLSQPANLQEPTRSGALLRLTFPHGVGFADCHPWESLGDVPLQSQLECLKNGVLTPLTERCIKFASLDSLARSEKKSLFSNFKSFPHNNLLISHSKFLSDYMSDQKQEALKKMGISTFKIKVKGTEEERTILQNVFAAFPATFKIRMDFNYAFPSSNEFLEWIKPLEKFAEMFDYLEDPFYFDDKSWFEFEKTRGISLALDQCHNDRGFYPLDEFCKSRTNLQNESPSVIVIKPAVQDVNVLRNYPEFLARTRVVFTSYLGHPLGQLAGLYSAAHFYNEYPEKKEICGIITHLSYKKTSYSERLVVKDGILLPLVSGTGFGFDDLLEQENWQTLSVFEK